jgi:PleD family two-component response regulator
LAIKWTRVSENPAAHGYNVEDAEARPMKILVADDDRIAATVLAQTLRQWEFDVTVAADGAEALRHLQAVVATPMLAILDWMMPQLEGADVCRRVRLEMPWANMYLMLLTSLESKDRVVAGLEAGADDYLIKPFDPDELRARINVGIRVLTLQERLAERVNQLQDALTNVKQLHGLLPICSYCKRIRGDDQYWTAVESYIAERSDAQFSHGICPPCASELEREIVKHRHRRQRE